MIKPKVGIAGFDKLHKEEVHFVHVASYPFGTVQSFKSLPQKAASPKNCFAIIRVSFIRRIKSLQEITTVNVILNIKKHLHI